MLLLLAALWGSSYLFIKIGVDDGLSPAFISFTRLALGALVLIPVAADRRPPRPARPRRHRRVPRSRAACRSVPPDHDRRTLDLVVARGHPRRLGADLHRAPGLLAGQRRALGRRAAPRCRNGIAASALLRNRRRQRWARARVGAVLVLLASLAYAVGALVLKRRLGDTQPVAMAAGAVSAGAACSCRRSSRSRPPLRRRAPPLRWWPSASAEPASRSSSSIRSSRRSVRLAPRSSHISHLVSPCSTASRSSTRSSRWRRWRPPRPRARRLLAATPVLFAAATHRARSCCNPQPGAR